MCAIEPIYKYNVTPERLEKVSKSLNELMPHVTQQQLLEVFMEVGLADGVRFVDGQPTMEMTELQMCAVVAALAAMIEGGARMVLNDRFREASDIFLT